jgi:hypothetical protein
MYFFNLYFIILATVPEECLFADYAQYCSQKHCSYIQQTKPNPVVSPLLKAQDLFTKVMLSAINYTDACDAMNLAFSEEGLVQILVEALTKLKDCTAHHVQYMVRKLHT